MATYAIGDIQGCFSALQKLLEIIRFDPKRDRLWLVGDLVNRGSQSLAALRWARNMGDALTMVLGNHDLHLLAVAEGFVPPHRSDTIQDILAAPDRVELLDWLRRQPLLYLEDEFVLVHAGLLPQWTPQQARGLAAEVEAELAGDNYREFFAHMYGNHPNHWHDDLTGISRLRTITNAMTRLRFCTPDGVIDFAHKGPADNPPEGLMPWFDVPDRKSRDATILFGHWSALGLKVREDIVGLDSGCLWRGSLTALRLEDRQVFQYHCVDLPGARHWQ